MESKINQKKNCVRHRGQRRDHEKNNIKIHKRSQDIHYCSAGRNDGVVCSPSYPVWHAGYAAVRGGASYSCTAGCLCVPADVRGKKEGKEKIKKDRIGKAVGAALSVFLAIGSVGLWAVDSFLNGITVAGTDVVRKDLSVIVPEDSEINSEADLTGEMTMAVYRLVSEEERASCQRGLKAEAEPAPQTEEYDSLNEIAEALYEGAVDAAVIDEPSRSVIEDEWPDFSEKTRVIFSIYRAGTGECVAGGRCDQ